MIYPIRRDSSFFAGSPLSDSLWRCVNFFRIEYGKKSPLKQKARDDTM